MEFKSLQEKLLGKQTFKSVENLSIRPTSLMA